MANNSIYTHLTPTHITQQQQEVICESNLLLQKCTQPVRLQLLRLHQQHQHHQYVHQCDAAAAANYTDMLLLASSSCARRHRNRSSSCNTRAADGERCS